MYKSIGVFRTGDCLNCLYGTFLTETGDYRYLMGNATIKNGCGYFEDRRPAANIDPYLATAIIAKTCCTNDDIKQ